MTPDHHISSDEVEDLVRRSRNNLARMKAKGRFSIQSSRSSWRLRAMAGLSPVAFTERGLHFSLPLNWSEKCAAVLIEQAHRGNADADQVLRESAIDLISCGERLPEQLRKYIIPLLEKRTSGTDGRRRKPGKNEHDNILRDRWIAYNVDKVRSRGLNPTRNRASRRDGNAESACSVVATALSQIGLTMSEENVEKIWAKWGPYWSKSES